MSSIPTEPPPVQCALCNLPIPIDEDPIVINPWDMTQWICLACDAKLVQSNWDCSQCHLCVWYAEQLSMMDDQIERRLCNACYEEFIADVWVEAGEAEELCVTTEDVQLPGDR